MRTSEHAEAAVLTGPGTIELQRFPLPELGPDDGLLQVENAGVCGSDIGPFLAGGAPLLGARRIDPPVILGHEVVGRIADVGGQAAERWGVQVGDRVVIERWLPCYRCNDCQRGSFSRCRRGADEPDLYYGGTPTTTAPHLWGGFATHLYLHPSTILHKVSGEGRADVYPLFLPLANAISWVQHTGGLRVGGDVLVQGPGPIGLACVLVARAAGARRVIVSGLEQDGARLELAQAYGASEVVTDGPDAVVERCLAATDGRGVDVVIDGTSTASSVPIEVGVRAAAAGATIVVPSDHGGADLPAVVLSELVQKTLHLVGVRSRRREAVTIALRLLDDPVWREQLQRMCDPILPLADTQRAFEAACSGEAIHASVTIGTGVA